MIQVTKMVESGPRTLIKCDCGHDVFDGIVFRTRVLRLRPDGVTEGKCRCKRWNELPLTYTP